MALTFGSCAMGIREPGQGRNTAALSGHSHVTQGCLRGVNCEGNVYCEISKRNARFLFGKVLSPRRKTGIFLVMLKYN